MAPAAAGRGAERTNRRNRFRDRTWESHSGAFLTCTLEGDWLNLWIDATYVKAREVGRIVMLEKDDESSLNRRYIPPRKLETSRQSELDHD